MGTVATPLVTAAAVGDTPLGAFAAPAIETTNGPALDQQAALAQQQLAQPALNRELAMLALPGDGTLTTTTAAGNQASAAAPTALKVGAHVGARDVQIKALKERLGYLQGMQSLHLPAQLKAQFAGDQAALTTKLQREVAIDWLVNVAWASGAPADVVGKLDEASVEVVPDSSMESDAEYDDATKTIHVSQKMVARLQAEVNDLAQRNVIDRVNGIVTDPYALRASGDYHDLVVDQALMAHEATHGVQDARGDIAVNRAAMQPEVGAMLVTAGDARTAAEQQVVKEYVDRFEYETYATQERYQWQMGAAPQTQAWMTLDNAGQPLPRAQAVDNIYAMYQRTGFTGETVARIVGVDATSAAQGRRMPGDAAQGDALEGRRMPGDALEGRRMPGDALEGRRMPGDALEGRRMPGDALA